MSVLKRAKKVRVDTEEWQLVNMNPSQIKILKELSLVDLDEPIKQRRGRPKKSI